MRLVAVLGYSGRRDDDLHDICEDRVRHAEGVARPGDVVLLSGEAELMLDAWAGGEALLDPHARNTRENAAGVAEAAQRLGADEVVLVTSTWHAFRARALVRAALGDRTVAVTSSSPAGRPPVRLAVRELACLAALPVQLLAVQRADQGVRRRPVRGTRGG